MMLQNNLETSFGKKWTDYFKLASNRNSKKCSKMLHEVQRANPDNEEC